jgi:trehalose 6-phosphate phosphatase
MTGKMVYEIKFDTYNKGTALDCLMKRAPFTGRRPVFIGDDITDVYGFEKASALGGTGFSVGREMSHASAMFDSAQDVRNAIAQGLAYGGRR